MQMRRESCLDSHVTPFLPATRNFGGKSVCVSERSFPHLSLPLGKAIYSRLSEKEVHFLGERDDVTPNSSAGKGSS